MHRIYFLIVLVSTIFNQNIYLFSSTEANSAIRSPKDFLGYEIGDYYTPHYRVVNYFKYLNQAAKNQSKLIEYGKTYEQRSLNILIISSAANMAILEDYREANLALANGKNAAETPVFVWLAYNVHGNETSSSEAAMMTAYHLLAATDQQTKSFLDNAIIVIDPMINPDGRDRFVNWFQHTVGKQANADPNSIEHFEPWPGGRTNHYYFDLNRDWTWASQVETQQRLKIYHQYKPQVYVDFHEMGYNSSYFFFPAAKPFSPYYPESTQKWGKVFGEGNAKMMSRFGRLFYTAQWFDLFYPGYGDSYPSLIGSIGMTYEQGGHSSGGKLVEREDGTQLSLLERASNHYHTSMATIETAVTNKKNLLTDFSRFFKDALNTADKQNFESYIIDSKAANYDLFLNVLSYHDIDLTYVDGRQTVTANGRKQTLTNGQAIVSIKQPNYRLIRTLFDDRVAIPDTAFYDISAWSLPVSFNVPVYKTSDRIKVKTTMAKTPVTFVKSEYAYAFVPIANNTLKFLDQLQRHKIRTRFANKEFTQNGQHFPAGTVLLSNFRNQDISDYHSIVERLAKQFDVQMVALSNGLSDDGIDLGSGDLQHLPEAKVAILIGDQFSSNQIGSLWYLFDQLLEDNVSMVPLSSFNRIDLNRYNTLIIGNGFGLSGAFGKSGIEKLKDWVSNGGHVIGIDRGAEFLADKDVALSSLKEPEKKKDENKDDDEREKFLKYKDRDDYFNKRSNPGAYYEVIIDDSHPLSVGVQSPFHVLKTDRTIFELNKSTQNIAYFTDKNILGFSPKSVRESINKTAFFSDETYRSGKVTMINADPTYRMFQMGSTKLLLNAVYFGMLRF